MISQLRGVIVVIIPSWIEARIFTVEQITVIAILIYCDIFAGSGGECEKLSGRY